MPPFYPRGAVDRYRRSLTTTGTQSVATALSITPATSSPANVHASATVSLFVARSVLPSATAANHAMNLNEMLYSTILVFAAPIPLLASFFLVWITRLHRSPNAHGNNLVGRKRQSCGLTKVQPTRNRRRNRLMAMAHVLLIATFLNLVLTASVGYVNVLRQFGVFPAALSITESRWPLLGQVVLGVSNGLASIVAQSTGEVALVYQFTRIYPERTTRWRILPLATLFIATRLISHSALNAIVIWSMIDPPMMPTLRSYLRLATACFSLSVMAIILLLSATFVYKLSSRWRRHVTSQRNNAKLLGGQSALLRIRGILVASWHHTILTSLCSVAMTASFPFIQSSLAAYWINLAATTLFKLSFALGISRSLYHMAYDSVSRHRIHFLATVNLQSRVAARGEQRRNDAERLRRRRGGRGAYRQHGEAEPNVDDVERLSPSSSSGSFMYNSWGLADSDSGASDAVYRHGHGGRARADPDRRAPLDMVVPPSERPIATTNVESAPFPSLPPGLAGHRSTEALPLSPAAVEGSSPDRPVPALSSAVLHSRSSKLPPQLIQQLSSPYLDVDQDSILCMVGPVWDTFAVAPHHQEPWPIRSLVIESDPGHSTHCSAAGHDAHPVAPAQKGKEKTGRRSNRSTTPKSPKDTVPKRINLAMNSLREPQEVVDHFSDYVCHRFETNAVFYHASVVRNTSSNASEAGSTPPTTSVPPIIDASATVSQSPDPSPSHHLPSTSTSNSSNSNDSKQQQKLPADQVPGAKLCYQTMMEVLALPSSSPSNSSPSTRQRAEQVGSKGSAANTLNKVKDESILFLPVHFNGRKLGVFVLAPWDPPGKPSKSFDAGGSQQRSDSVPRFGSHQLIQGPLNDPSIELVRQLVRFFAAYYYSAQERQLNQETMRKFQERLAIMEATANAKSTFLANMSHEIRTPAAQVIQAVHMLSETELNPIQREHVQVIIRSSELLLAILNDVLDLSKLENGKIRFENRPFDLHEALRQSVDAYMNPRKPVDVGCVIDAALPQFIVGDVVRLRQIFNNLLSNAVKFTTVGHVLLRAMLVSMDSGSARVRFSVQDTGCGIPQDRLASIFERFEQSDETITRLYGGTGLGLSICQSLCSLMNSSLEVTSELNRGSNFSFEVSLPFAPADYAVPPHLLSPPPPILDPSAPPRLIRLVICNGLPSDRPLLSPRSAARAKASRSGVTSGPLGLVAGASPKSPFTPTRDVMHDLLANYGIVVATVHTTCDAIVDSANAPGTGPAPNIVVIACPKRWPPIPPGRPKIPTVIVSGCDILDSSDDGPTLVPPRSPYSNLAYVARPFKQSHLYRVLDSVAGIGDALPLSTVIDSHGVHHHGGTYDSALAAEPPPHSQPAVGHVSIDSDAQGRHLPSANCACNSTSSTGVAHDAPSVIASDLSSSTHTHVLAHPGFVAGGYPPLRVLIVDDNPLNRKLMQAMVAKLGHEVELADNGKMAVDRVLAMTATPSNENEAPEDVAGCGGEGDDEEVAPAIDCIFMDVRMPIMDGLEASRIIVAHFDSLPDAAQRARRPIILGLSADAMQESEEAGLFNGMDVYLRKPLLRKDIEAALNQYFGPSGPRYQRERR